jgi:hypothetical protein
MNDIAAPQAAPLWMLWTGRVLTALPILMMLFSAGMKFSHSREMVASFTVKFGFPEGALLVIGIVELACLALYAIPQTSVLGAILMTGYLGGAMATHVRLGEPFVIPLLLGVLAWGGLYLREPRLRALIPLRN